MKSASRVIILFLLNLAQRRAGYLPGALPNAEVQLQDHRSRVAAEADLSAATSCWAAALPPEQGVADQRSRSRVRTDELNDNADDEIEPRTELQSADWWLAGVNRQLGGESPLVCGPRFAAGDIGSQVRKFVQN